MRGRRTVFPACISLGCALLGGTFIGLSGLVLPSLAGAPDRLRLISLYTWLFLLASSSVGLFFAVRNVRNGKLSPVKIGDGDRQGQVHSDWLRALAQKATQDTKPRLGIVNVPIESEPGARDQPENSPLVTATLDHRGIILKVNRAAEEVSGYTSAELVGKPALGFIHPDQRDALQQLLNGTLAAGGRVTHQEVRLLDKQGRTLWLEGNARSFLSADRTLHLSFIGQDISARKQAETQIRVAEARYRALVEQIPAAVYTETFNQRGSQVYVSPQIEKITGFTPAEWLADPDLWRARIHPEDREAVLAEDGRTNLTLEPYNTEYRAIRRDGEIIWLRDQAVLIRDEEGTPLYWQGVLVDITEQKRVREAILQSEERFGKAFRSSPIPTRITTWEEGSLIDANPAYWEFSGYDPEDLLGQSILSLETTNHEKYRTLLDHLRSQRSIQGEQGKFITRAGKVLDVSVYHEIIRLNDAECVLSMFQDITEQKRAEENLARKEAILKSIAFAADQFLTAPGWKTSIPAILARLGQAAEASRVYLFRANPEQNNIALVTQLFEWCSPAASPQIGNDALKHFDMVENGLDRWVDLMSAGKPVFGIVRELPTGEQAEFVREDILSIICVPILINNQWWGFIGLDDCLQERLWSESEIEALQTAGSLISAAIQRERAGDEAQKQLGELMMLHAAALASSTALDLDGLLSSVTDIIENTLRPDNCGVLLVDETRGLLVPHYSYRGNILDGLEQPHSIEAGIAGLVARTGQAQRIADVRTTPEFIMVSPDVRSELCVPIISSGQVTGVINLESREADAFDEADERLVYTIAGGLATAIQKLRLFEAEARRAREAEALREATTALTSSLDLNTLLNTTLDLLIDFAPYDRAWIELLEEDVCRIAAGRNLAFGLLGSTQPIDPGKWSLQDRREPFIVSEALLAGSTGAPGAQPSAGSRISVPLYAQDALIGFINLENGIPGFYTPRHASVAQTFANQAAIAIQNAHLYDAEQQRRREAEILREAAAAVSADLDQAQAIQRILEQLAKVLPLQSASVQLLRDGYLEIVGGTGWPEPSRVLGMRFRVPGDNPNSRVITEARSLVLNDAPSEFDAFKAQPHDHIRSWLGVPLTVDGSVIGMLAIDHGQANFYRPEHVRLAELFANQAAIAITNARTFEDEKRRSQIIQALADLANEFATTQEMGHLLDKLSQRALGLLHASHVAIYLVQSDNKTVKVVSAQGTYSNQLMSHTIRIGEGITGNVIAAGRAEIINDTRTDPRTITVPGTPKEDGEVETMMSAPLILRGKPIGAINAWRLRSDGLFNESELNFLISIAHQTSISVELGRLFSETNRRAQEAAAVAEVGRDISATLELDLVLERIAQYAKDLLNAETSAVYMHDPADSKLHGVAVFGVDAEEIKNDPLVLGTGIAGHIALSKHGEIVNYASSDPRGVTIKGTTDNPYEHIMGVPVLNKDELTGLLVVWRTGPDLEFQPSELNFLSSLAQQAAVAIQNARSFAAEQHQRLREAAMLDLMRLAASSLDLDEVNLTILGHLIQLIPCDSGTIQILRGERLHVSAAIGFPSGTIRMGSSLLLEDFPLNNEVVTQKVPIRIADAREDDRYRWIPGVEYIRSMLAVPIVFRGDVIGMATLDSPKVGRFTQEDEELAIAVANNAANAIGNATLFEREQQGRQGAENLRMAAAAVTSSLDPHQVLETILTALKEVVPYDSASILLIEGDQVRITAGQGLPDQEAAIGQTFPAISGMLRALAESHNEPVILYDAQVEPGFEHWVSADNVRGWMGVPLVARGETVGYITLDSFRVGTFDRNSASLAQTFAYQAAVAIDNARLYQETRRRLEELEVVSRVSFALRALHNHLEMLPVLLTEVMKTLDTDTASIWLYDAATDQLHQGIASGWHEQLGTKQRPTDDSLIGHVFRNGEVQLIEEFPGSPYDGDGEASGARKGWGGVAVPIRTATQPIGAIVVAVPLPRRVEPAQLTLLTTLAEIAGNAIHRAELFDQSEEQVRRLTALRDVDTAIASSFDLRVTLNILLDHMLSQLHADAAAILSYNPEMRTLNHISSLGFHQPSSIQAPLRVTGRLLNEALLERKDINVENIQAEHSFHRRDLANLEKFVSCFAAPLISKGQVKGIIELYFRGPRATEPDWLDFFQAMAGQAAIAIDNSQLFENLQRSNQELSLAYDTTLEGWGKALELRDKETQGHTLRVTDLTLRLARRLGIPEADLVHVRRGVLLHDIGKMGVPDQILKKTGPLTEQEWTEMRMHPQHAYDLLLPISYLRPALDIPYCHHERWDGAGYPRGIRGEDIPIAARIFAVVDVWDALLNDRPYRRAWPRDQVLTYMRGEVGTRFDPRVAMEFLKMVEEERFPGEGL